MKTFILFYFTAHTTRPTIKLNKRFNLFYCSIYFILLHTQLDLQ